MKETRDWDEKYILTSLSFGEFDWLEVKGSRVFKADTKDVDRDVLSKAVSAFSNSGGGTLILGLKKTEKTWQVDNGGIDVTFRKPNTREWLEDIIPNLVDLPLQIFNVYEITRKYDDSQIEPNKAIYLIYIGDSPLAPHQASDKIYYGRVAGKSKPLSHRFVMDINGRRRDPIINIGIYYSYDENLEIYFLEIILINIGRVYASYVNSFIYVPKYLVYDPEKQIDFCRCEKVEDKDYAVFCKRNTRRDPIQLGSELPEFGPARYDPILPGLYFSARINLKADFYEQCNDSMDTKIYWKVYADNTPFRKGIKLLREIKNIND